MISITHPLAPPIQQQGPRIIRRSFCLSNIVLVAVCAVVLMTALAFRLPRLDVPSNNYDEGVYLESLLLMRDGYRPFQDIVATQGPLHLYLAYPSYALGGYTLTAARLGTVMASLLGVLGVGVAAGVLFGRLGGIGAALVLALSPTYLTVSRQTLPEPTAIGLSAVAVACAVVAGRTGRTHWQVLAGVLLGLACLVKPIVGSTVLPVVALASDRRSLRSWAVAPVTAALVGLLGLAAVGPGSSLGQVVGWRLAAGQFSVAAIPHNAALLVDKMLFQEHPAVYALAIMGAAVLWTRGLRPFLAIAGWAASALLVLLSYTELSGHLGATLLVPLALLAGAAIQAPFGAVRWSSRVGRWSSRTVRWSPSWASLLLVLPVAAWAGLAVPSVVGRDNQITAGLTRADREGADNDVQAAQMIAAMTEPDEMIITDAPYLAFLANRRMPPGLVDPSSARIQAGAVTSEQMIGSLDTYDADVVVLWTGKLARLEAFFNTIEQQYTSVASFGTIDKGTPRAVYVRYDDAPGGADDRAEDSTADPG